MPDMTPEELTTPPNLTDNEQLQIKRELQLLKGEDGEYVLSSLASMYALPKLIEYIQERDQQRLIEAATEAFKNSTNQNIDGDAKYWSPDGDYNAQAMDKFFPQQWFDEKFLPALTAALGPDNSSGEEKE